MTKKDYKKIAEALRVARAGSDDKEVIRHIITELIRVFKADNERFSAEKFEQAIYEK